MSHRRPPPPSPALGSLAGLWAVRWPGLIAAVVLTLLTVAVYSNSFRVPYLFDDHDAIENNRSIRQLWPIWDALDGPAQTTVAGRPLLNLSFAVNYTLGGIDVWGYHAGNLLIHAICACLVFGILRRTFLSPSLKETTGAAAFPLALAIAAIWTVHPLHTMCVTYIVQRAESLMGLFYLLTLYLVIRSHESPRPHRWQVAAVLAFLAGVGCKEAIATAPIVVFLYDAIFLAGTFRGALRQRAAMYFALILCWIPLGLLIAWGPRSDSTGFSLPGLSLRQYFRTQPQVILYYLRLVVWPTPLCLDYDWPVANGPWDIALPGLVIVSLLAATAWGVLLRRPWSFLGVWFFSTLAISSSVVPIVIVASEHRMYLPSVAPITAIILICWWLSNRVALLQYAFVRIAVVVLVVGLLCWVTMDRNFDYRTQLAIWQQTVDICPNNPRALTNLGAELEDAGRREEALSSLEKAVRRAPWYSEPRYNYGVTLGRMGRIDEATAEFRECIRLKPTHVSAHHNLGCTLKVEGHLDEAEYHFRAALSVDPEYGKSHAELGVILAIEGKSREAVGHLRAATRLNSETAAQLNALAWILATDPDASLRAGAEAIQAAEKAKTITGENASALDTLAAAYAEAGRFADAVTTADKAISAADAANEPLSDEIRSRLELYRQGRSYHGQAPATRN